MAGDAVRKRGRKNEGLMEPESNGLKPQHGPLPAWNLGSLVCEVRLDMPTSLNCVQVE